MHSAFETPNLTDFSPILIWYDVFISSGLYAVGLPRRAQNLASLGSQLNRKGVMHAIG